MNGVPIEKVLGAKLSDDLKWNAHVAEITAKAGKRFTYYAALNELVYPKKTLMPSTRVRSDPYLSMHVKPGMQDIQGTLNLTLTISTNIVFT